MDSLVYPMHYAYPVLEIGFEAKTEKLFNKLKKQEEKAREESKEKEGN